MDLSNTVTGVGLAIIDGQVRYVEVNRYLAALNGIPEVAHIGRPLTSVVPEIGSMLTEFVHRALKTKHPIRDVKFTARVPFVTGPRRDWLASFFPVNLGGDVIGVSHTVMEITARTLVETELSELALAIREPIEEVLTSREGDVLTLIGQGKTTKEIAALLSISAQTVGNHRKQICRKLDIHATAELVAFASRASELPAWKRRRLHPAGPLSPF